MSRNLGTHTRASQQAFSDHGPLSHAMSQLAAAALTGSLVIAISMVSYTLSSGSALSAPKGGGGGGGDKTTLGSLSCTSTSPSRWR